MGEKVLPPNSTVLGIDYGLKRIGLSVGQLITASATPLNNIPAKDGVPDWVALERVVNEWRPALVIVGRPLHMDGTPSEMTHRTDRFIRQLRSRFQLCCLPVDERLTSVEAESLLKDKEQSHKKNVATDSLAACLILEGWMRDYTKCANDPN